MSDWIEYNVGDPIPKGIVEVQLHGTVPVGPAVNADEYIWTELGRATITHYRFVKPETDTVSKPTNPKDSIGIRKAPMSTVPAGVIAEVGLGLLEGAAKYGRHNYRALGVRASVYYDATMRHLMQWWEGEDTDPDSGLSHITKAITSLVVLRDAMMQGMVTDDRPPSSAPFMADLNERAGQIIDKYAGKNPRHYTVNDTKES
jgi:Domain of unknown function (DUF5664)